MPEKQSFEGKYEGYWVSFFEIGKQEAAEATLEALKVVPESLGKWASILVEICAYAGKEYNHVNYIYPVRTFCVFS